MDPRLSALIAQIPATFWGVVVGSLFTLGGITLSNRNSARNLKRQLDHDRTQRNRQREMDLRREVYLQASAAVSAVLYSLGRLSDLNVTIPDALRLFSERAPDVAKVNVIAGERAIKFIGVITMQLNSAFMDLEARRLPGKHIKGLLDSAKSQLARYVSDQNRSIEMMKEENYRGQPDAVKWAAIQHNYKFETEQIAKLLRDDADLKQKMLNEQLAVSQRSIELIGRVHRGLSPALAAVRAELDLEGLRMFWLRFLRNYLSEWIQISTLWLMQSSHMYNS